MTNLKNTVSELLEAEAQALLKVEHVRGENSNSISKACFITYAIENMSSKALIHLEFSHLKEMFELELIL